MKINRLESDFRPSLGEMFFLDTNVWLYLYYPHFSKNDQRLADLYSAFFAKVASEPIQTNLVQMSELINAVIRAEYKVYQAQGNRISFKEYRECDHGKNALGQAHTIVSNILKSATLRSGVFTPDELKAMVMKCDKADFNDIYFAHYCLRQKLTLVTHDFDFNASDESIVVLSGNSRYFR